MTRSIAIVGAGPGLGRALAHRFGREGYQAALVARSTDTLADMVAGLSGNGITAAAVAADLTDTDAATGLLADIRAAVGEPEVLYYGPAPTQFIPAAELTPERVDPLLNIMFRTPLALIAGVLPAMKATGHGSVLVTGGGSALSGRPGASGLGPGAAALRNYLESLHGELEDRGVYVGRLYISSFIEDSTLYVRSQEGERIGDGAPRPTVSPALLADLLWDMHTRTHVPEQRWPEPADGH